MREDDLPQALEWDNDPEVHHFMQDDSTPQFTLEDLRDMYRGIARAAHVFVIELAGRDIGTCWLQDMNVERLKQRFPGRALKRIDLSIGVKDLWAGESARASSACSRGSGSTAWVRTRSSPSASTTSTPGAWAPSGASASGCSRWRRRTRPERAGPSTTSL